MAEFNKNSEICLGSFWDDPMKKIPHEVKERLDRNLPNVAKVLTLPEDPAHRSFHIIEGIAAIDLVAPLIDLSEEEKKKAKMAFRFHDLGYKIVNQNLIGHEDHHLASLYLANKLTDDLSILSAVFNHSADVLPFDTPLWARVVRDVDRVLLMGAIGITRLSSFMGFSHEAFDESLEAMIERGALIDLNFPLNEAFGEKSFEFFVEEVFPSFDTHDKLLNLSRLCKGLLEKVDGYSYREMWSYGPRYHSIREIERNHIDWQIEPIHKVIYRVYEDRIDETHAIRAMAREGYDPRGNERGPVTYSIFGSPSKK